jgi:AcrR family transcriptional regulator
MPGTSIRGGLTVAVRQPDRGSSTSAEPAGPPVGRREAHKQATRRALQEAADRLFAERGVLQTTVRDIADAAGVTERTFFRYFRSKEDLLIGSAFAWMPALQQAILARPAAEPPLLALRRALASFMAAITRIDAASPLALFAQGAPADRLGLSALGVMRRLETDLADALEERLTTTGSTADDGGPRATDVRLRAEVIARTALAVFRTAMLHDSRLRRDDVTDRPSLGELLDRAFDALDESPRG